MEESATAAVPEVARVEDLVVTFGSFVALKGVDFSVSPGEVVGLLGENGAGKSTLIKVLSGVYRPTSGKVFLSGKEVSLSSPRSALVAGVATVHQHSMLAGNLSVASNLVLGEENARFGLLTTAQTLSQATEMVEQLDVDLPLGTPVDALSLASKQKVEIVRAASLAHSVMILDEPTSALEPTEVEELFRTIRQLRAKGVAIIYISHRLDEIPQICDRSVILRDGTVVAELPGDQCMPDKIIPLLAGRPIGDLFPSLPKPRREIALEAKDLRTDWAGPFDLGLARGEIVGLTGAEGAGQREIARAISGVERARGSIKVDGAEIGLGDVTESIQKGIVYVSGDRSEGVYPELSVWKNAAVGLWPKLARWWGYISGHKEKTEATEVCESFRVKADDLSLPITALSGGNQQKVLIGRGAAILPKILVLDEPTLGVDVGARREIYDLVKDLVDQGMSVVLVSSDQAEIQAMSHRVIVFADGRPVAELAAEGATEEAILAARYTREIQEKDGK